MQPLTGIRDDFEAVIRIYSTEEGGRVSAACNGIRWDFSYAEDPVGSEIYMIFPDFLDERGESLPNDKPLPVGVELNAKMTVGIDSMRAKVHRSCIREGQRFYCREGAKRVAEGIVTRITGLLSDRPSPIEPIT